jgi:hypothetical protein
MSVIRPGTVVWFCIVVAVGYAMFQVKYEVMQQEQTLAGINKQIADDRDQIRVLDAEWSYLTRPSRIEQLAGRFLHLSDMSAAQIVPIGDLPLRAPAPAAALATQPKTGTPLPAAMPATGARLAAIVAGPTP